MKRRELESLVQQCRDGVIDEADFERLQSELKRSAESRAFYRHSMRVEAGLEASMGLQIPKRAGVVPVERLLQRQRRRAVGSAMAIAAVLFLCLGLWLWQRWIPASRSPMVEVEVTAGSIFSSSVSIPSQLSVGDRVDLVIGVAKLKLPGGSEVMLEGPTRMRIAGETQLILEEGRALCEVSEMDSRAGFRVRTDRAEYQDIGTRFGVVHADDALDQLHVFDGQVVARARQAFQDAVDVSAGEAVQVTPVGRWQSIELDRDGFQEALPPTLPGIHMAFEEEGPLAVVGMIPGTRPVEARLLSAGSPQLTNGVVGRALSMRRAGDAIETNWKGIGGDDPRTLSCWIRLSAEPMEDFASVVSWGTAGRKNGRWSVVVARSSRAGGRVLRLGLTSVFFSGTTVLEPERWYHVAVVFRGSRAKDGEAMVEFYVDGRREEVDSRWSRAPRPDDSVETVIDSPDSTPVRIGLHPNPDHRENSFRGDIDELRIFPYALTPSAIDTLATQGSEVPEP